MLSSTGNAGYAGGNSANTGTPYEGSWNMRCFVSNVYNANTTTLRFNLNAGIYRIKVFGTVTAAQTGGTIMLGGYSLALNAGAAIQTFTRPATPNPMNNQSAYLEFDAIEVADTDSIELTIWSIYGSPNGFSIINVLDIEKWSDFPPMPIPDKIMALGGDSFDAGQNAVPPTTNGYFNQMLALVGADAASRNLAYSGAGFTNITSYGGIQVRCWSGNEDFLGNVDYLFCGGIGNDAGNYSQWSGAGWGNLADAMAISDADILSSTSAPWNLWSARNQTLYNSVRMTLRYAQLKMKAGSSLIVHQLVNMTGSPTWDNGIPSGTTWADFNSVLHDVCDAMGLIWCEIPAFNIDFTNAANRTTYLSSDSFHPNTAWHTLAGVQLAEWVETNLS
jgi:hypothetical protein